MAMRKALLLMVVLSASLGSAPPAVAQREPAPPPPPVVNPLPIFSALPELKLNIPSPIKLSRMVEFTIDPIVAPEGANYSIPDYSVDWVAVQRTTVADMTKFDPLDSDLKIDRLDGTRAWMPTGSSPSIVNISVTVTLEIKEKDGSTHLEKLKKRQDVQFGNPLVDPVHPDPVPGPVIPKPNPDPNPPAPVVVDPTLPDGKYKLAAWTYKTLKDSQAQPAPVAVTKAEGLAIANGFRQIASMTRNNKSITPTEVVAQMGEVNRNNAGKNLDNWIQVFFEPLRVKLNSVNRIVVGTSDQATTYEEIANGLEAWSKLP